MSFHQLTEPDTENFINFGREKGTLGITEVVDTLGSGVGENHWES